ncbi:MAG: glycosyltransferase family 2 protein [Candidatus Omnitrophica bacterium]|nr:glycosyltransferase family 2 protein [Candidatus Omnitrophota bacterium]
MFTKEFNNFFIHQHEQIKKHKRWGRYIHGINFQRIKSMIPRDAKVLAIGPRISYCLAWFGIQAEGLVVDPYLDFMELPHIPNFELSSNPEALEKIDEKFDCIVLSFAIGMMEDIYQTLVDLRRFCHSRTRIIITYYNRIWQPAITLAEKLGFKTATPAMNWAPIRKIEDFMSLADIQIVKETMFCLVPFKIPFVSNFMNRYLGNLPFLNRLGVLSLVVGRVLNLRTEGKFCFENPKVSVIVPAKNEEGNIAEIVERIPQFSGGTEIIFVEGGSTDSTRNAIEKAIQEHPRLDISLLTQDGRGKKDAAQKGLLAATGDILAILDADMTVAPESLTLFVHILTSGKGEFVNGSRMVYPMRGKAMRFLNSLGNRFFSHCFSYLLGQNIDDTLCGTKVFFKNDYLNLLENSPHFGNWDPYGDFDLLFGATYLNLKIVDLPVRYSERGYGTTNIRRWRDGMFLLRMVVIGAFKLKFDWLSPKADQPIHPPRSRQGTIEKKYTRRVSLKQASEIPAEVLKR